MSAVLDLGSNVEGSGFAKGVFNPLWFADAELVSQ